MRVSSLRDAAVAVYKDINCNHTFAIAAGLAYYFFLSIFPLLIFFAATLAYLPIPNMFNAILDLMAKFVPAEAMGLVRTIVKGVLNPPRGGLLSFGLLATLWAATGGFSAMIEALNIAYEVPETRPYWRTRLLAIGLALLVGSLVVLGLAGTLVGPKFGDLLVTHAHIHPLFSILWPYMRWTIVLASIVFAVELLYFWAPNVKQKFICTLPGSFLGVGVWIAASFGLGVYIREFANYNATYGTLGGVIALMLWFYLSAVAILVGGEINSKLLKAAGKKLPVKEPDPVKEAKKAATIDAVEKVEERFEPIKAA
jgi:membrane protein